MDLDPSYIMMIGTGYGPSKTLLSAVELGVFTQLGDGSATGEEIGAALGLHPRAVWDFLDALVALRFLDRDGNGKDARYRNTPETATFLDKNRPQYIGGILEMCNARLFRFWADLTEALRTGRPQNEIKYTGKPMFEGLYADPDRLEQFMHAMESLSLPNFEAFARRFDFSPYQTLCDVGGATGQLCIVTARRHPHLRNVTFDLPPVQRIARKTVEAAGLGDRVEVVSGDIFAAPLPRADVITMSLILHDWDLGKKMHLIRSAYEALPPGGAFVAIENMIDDARRKNVFGLISSLNMLIETGDAFDFTGADFSSWCSEAGFKKVEILPLTASASAGVAVK
jgi:SAM-dependent methyltransferase